MISLGLVRIAGRAEFAGLTAMDALIDEIRIDEQALGDGFGGPLLGSFYCRTKIIKLAVTDQAL